ncbi:hypothetical protein EJ03DRAFT_6741 [Teratosphaeria nubilosa]|uniref:Uncharacterized protein n=1 Tax=Teratosphaeria nubilosa TaxID=161662 RepID=A0A6G1LP67_9PEZI|nr:hypothetical protein EJ03DRAFT_6741 [Teratosphaeria nubilosa]
MQINNDVLDAAKRDPAFLANLNPPTRGTRRTITHPVTDDVLSYQKTTMRAKTSTYRESIGYLPTPQKLASKIYERVIRNLDEAQLRTNRIQQARFHFLLPDDSATNRQLNVFVNLSTRPMTVTTQDMSEVIDMELSNVNSPPTAEGYHIYVRSWAFTAKELRLLIEEMTQSDNVYEEVLEWKKVLDLYAPVKVNTDEDREATSSIDAADVHTFPAAVQGALNESDSVIDISKEYRVGQQRPIDIFTVRYVGVVSGPRRPYDRFMEDLQEGKSGIMHEFMQVVDRLLPHVADASQCHMLKGGSLTMAKDLAKTTVGDIERFVIEYLDHATLLNRQRAAILTRDFLVRNIKTEMQSNGDRLPDSFVLNTALFPFVDL